MKTKLFALILLIFNVSCSSVLSIESFRDPAYQNNTYKKISVNITNNNLSLRKKKEDMIVKIFSQYRIASVQNYKLFFPTRTYSNDQMNTIIRKNNIDAVLNIHIGSSGYSKVIIDGTTEHKPYLNIKLRLTDIETNETAWIGDGYNGGNAFEDLDDIYEEFFHKLASKLITQKVVKGKERTNNYKRGPGRVVR